MVRVWYHVFFKDLNVTCSEGVPVDVSYTHSVKSFQGQGKGSLHLSEGKECYRRPIVDETCNIVSFEEQKD